MPEIKLKPCPFCGGDAKIFYDNYGKYLAKCSCGLLIGIELETGNELIDGWKAKFDTFDEAVEAWNRRVSNDNKALEPEYEGDGYDDEGELVYDTAYCPICHHEYEVYYDTHDNYCRICGQKLDWRRAENETD